MWKKFFKNKQKKKVTFTHLWTIDNFAHLYDENCQWKWQVQSDEFAVPKNEDLKFGLKIWPKMKGEKDGEEYFQFGLIAEEMPKIWEEKVTMKWRCSLVDEEKKELFKKDYPERGVFLETRIGDTHYRSVGELLDPSKGYLKGGTLRLMCEMTLNCYEEAIFNSPENVHTSSHTTIPSSVSTFSHSFTIEHFKWLCEDRTRQMPLRVESDYFAPEREDIGKMRIEFYPKKYRGNDEENVEFAIRNGNTDGLHVHYEFFLQGANGDKFESGEATYRILPDTARFHSISRCRLLPFLDSLPTDQLNINYIVTILVKSEQSNALPLTTPTPKTTHIDLARFTFHYVSFTWPVERFLAQLTRLSIDSKPFSPRSDSRYSFSLRLYPNKDTKEVKLVLLYLSSYPIEKSKVQWKLSVVYANEDNWSEHVCTDFIKKYTQFDPHELILHRTLSDFASHLLPEDKLTIKCELWIHEPRKLPELLNLPPARASGGTNITNIHFTGNASLISNSVINESSLTQN